ncbi:MAG TPA: hypothetical protein PKG98_05095 [Myxococcota bacterium]|nr:hypothetical protein [Myxococcota bacterium]
MGILKNWMALLPLAAFVSCAVPIHSTTAGMYSRVPTVLPQSGPFADLPYVQGAALADDTIRSKGPTTGETGKKVAADKTGKTSAGKKKNGKTVAGSKRGAGKAGGDSKGDARGDRPVSYPDVKVDATVDRVPAALVETPVTGTNREATRVSMVPASGAQRTRLARAASRLVGIRNSFEARSFLGHLLAICDLLPEKADSASWNSVSQMERAGRLGTLHGVDHEPVPGDIVFFKCAQGCGSDSGGGIGAGVVVQDGKGRTRFIAYRDGVVGMFEPDKGFEVTGYSAP